MNIAFVLSYLSDRFGGPVAVVKGLGRALEAGGHGVSYWATGDEASRAELASFKHAAVYEVDWPRAWYRSTGLREGLRQALASVDLVHINEFWPYPPYIASRLARDHDVPYILRPAGSLQAWALRNHPAKRLKKAVYLSLIGKSMMRGAACIQAASMQEAECVRDLGYTGPLAVIPNGVHTELYAAGNGADAEAYWPELKGRPVVVFMSRLSPEKGLDLLIPVWADLVKSGAHKDAILVIAGPDCRGYRSTVEAMIEKCGVGAHVRMTGMVQGTQKISLLRRADVFVLPSYSENFGIVVAEALACGTPVVTTTSTPWRQLQEVDAGRWIRPAKPDLADALKELLAMSESQRATMGRRGTALVEKDYAWESVLGKFLTLCRCVHEGRAVPLHPEAAMEMSGGRTEVSG